MSLDESIYSSSMIRVAGAVRNILQLGVRLTPGRTTQAHPVAGQVVEAIGGTRTFRPDREISWPSAQIADDSEQRCTARGRRRSTGMSARGGRFALPAARLRAHPAVDVTPLADRGKSTRTSFGEGHELHFNERHPLWTEAGWLRCLGASVRWRPERHFPRAAVRRERRAPQLLASKLVGITGFEPATP